MMKRHFRHLLALTAALALTLVGTMSAQTSNGTIAGVVTDNTGAVVQNATVAARSQSTGEERSATTNDIGAFRIESLLPGTYTVTVNAGSFAPKNIKNIEVKASIITSTNVVLQQGATSEVVTVEGGAAQDLQTDSGEVSHNITAVEVSQLPVNSLNPFSLAVTEPGVVTPSTREDFTNGFGFSVNGTRPRANSFLIEGQENNDTNIQGQAIQPQNLDATKEVTVLTNSYSAEFGRGGGSVSNLIYKSGTNNWHGSLWELHRNSALNSTLRQDKINRATKAPDRENTFGFSLGGPIIKDKLFIFGSPQWDRDRTEVNGETLTLPTAAGVAALQSLGPNPRITNFLNAIGSLRGQTNFQTIALGSGRPGIQFGDVVRERVSDPNNAKQIVIKSDWLATKSDTLTVRYLFDSNDLNPDFFNAPGQLPGFDTLQGGTGQNAAIIHVHTFSPNVVNEFRFDLGRIDFSFRQTPETLKNPLASQPSVFVSGLNVAGFPAYGIPTNIPSGRLQNTYQFQDSVSYNHGAHSLKFGADLARFQVRDLIPAPFLGTITYNASRTSGSTPAFTALANFIDDFGGRGGSANRVFGSPISRPYFLQQSYFAEDSWKMRSNLTFTYGLRYENYGSPVNVLAFPAIDVKLGASDPTFPHRVTQQSDNNNFAPRVSLAYTPRFWQKLFGQDKTVFRAGYGMFYDSFFNNILDNVASGSPNDVSATLTSSQTTTNPRGTPNISTGLASLSPVQNPRASVSTIANNLVAPITHQWNFNIERELPGNFTLTTAYVGTRGIRLYANDQFNPVNPNDPNGLRMVPTRGSIQVRDNSGDSIYHGLDVKLDRRFTKGLLFRTSYTYSKLIDDASEVFVTTGTSSYPADLTLGHRGVDRGLSAFDRRHRLVFVYIYDIPKFTYTNNIGTKALGYLINNWQFSGTTAFQAGAPETVVDGFDNNGDGQANDRPNLTNAKAPLATYAFDNGDGTFCDGPTLFKNGSCTTVSPSSVHWVVPFSGIGNLGRNTQISPWRQDWTFAVQRTFSLHENHQLQFRTEMFNPFNHANTGNAPFNLSQIPVPGTDVNKFGNYGLTIAGQRQIRFWLKYSF